MLTKVVRSLLSDKKDDYTFYASSGNALNLNENKEAGLYLHVPFCKSMCPYCPYHKVLYDPKLVKKFLEALKIEIQRWHDKIGQREFSSLYIGGGTPTLILDELPDVLGELKKRFVLNGPVALETNPGDLTSTKAQTMKKIGIDYVSLGVQSFQTKFLSCIGRNYGPDKSLESVQMVTEQKFTLSNFDLIFAFPRQTEKELTNDLETMLSFSPSQVTCYPLFTFPYTSIGRYKRIKKLKMPPILQRRKMYYLICQFFEENGYEQSSVWSFNKKTERIYSSVTRDYYVGLGPGAATYTGKSFYFNTFSIGEYAKAVSEKLPIALEMKVSARMERLFWFYWRLYETKISISKYEKHFKTSLKKDFGFLIKLAKALGFLYRSGDSWNLNRRGAHWIHLLQNYYALNYVNSIWARCQEEAWPSKVCL